MLNSLTELEAWTRKLGEQVPALAHEIVLSDGGLSSDDLKSVEKALNVRLPESYGRVACAKGLYGVSIGYFGLWPTFDSGEDLRRSLIRANTEGACADLVWVARQEANPICIRTAGNADEGAVFRIDRMSSPEPRCDRIADSFEQFLLLAGNLQLLTTEPVESATDAMKEVCRRLSLPAVNAEFWLARAREEE
jgi:hypothetical protein